MADWNGWWREVRTMCDVSADGSVELTIEEIAAGAGSTDPGLRQRGWWSSMKQPNVKACNGVRGNGIECEPRPGGGSVESVVFRIAIPK